MTQFKEKTQEKTQEKTKVGVTFFKITIVPEVIFMSLSNNIEILM